MGKNVIDQLFDKETLKEKYIRNKKRDKELFEMSKQTGRNRTRGMKNVFKKTKGGVVKKVNAALDFESLTGKNPERRDRVLKRREKK